MAISFQAKDPLVLDRELKTQKVAIPFKITHNATPASKTVVVDEPAVLFLDLQGLNNITIASGALETGEVLPSGQLTPTDTAGSFVALCKIREPLVKAVSARLVSRDANLVAVPCEILAFTTGSEHSGQSIVVNCSTAVNFATTDLDATLEFEYITQE